MLPKKQERSFFLPTAGSYCFDPSKEGLRGLPRNLSLGREMRRSILSNHEYETNDRASRSTI
jgi:hypothetical protein